ncbi:MULTISPECIES: MFS transporter [Cupriavidus]|uniref:MFS transporter n=1 Tax=Cupriavidus TaxID=106589 RepID=UPI00157A5D0B|nr:MULTISPECIES: MFS transporter [Cupriavidus]MBB1632505.1 hypothetical protein [Cupriavidus sp. UME77]NUA27047.1 MFS transporter [Cupriavidus basilensis]
MNTLASSSEDWRGSKAGKYQEFTRGWRAIVLGFFGVAIAPLPVFLYIFGTLVQPLQEQFGWSRPDLQLSISFLFAGLVLATQIVGWFNRRWGMRNVTICSLIVLSMTWAIMPVMLRTTTSLYAFAFLLTLLGLGATQITWSNLVVLWFERNRGMALSMILCGSGLAATLFPFIVTSVIGQWGWRSAFWLMAVFPLAIVLPLTIFWFTTPREQSPVDAEAVTNVVATGLAFKEGVRSVRYWALTVALSIVVACVLSMMSISIPILRDKGFSADLASKIFGVTGISLIVGRIVVGYIIDRVWAPLVGAIVFVMPAVGALILANLSSPDAMLGILAMILVGIGTGAELDLGAFLVSRYFGTRDYGRLFGVHLSANTIASVAAPLIFSRVYVATGTYDSALFICAVGLFGAAMMLLTLGRYPRFEE